MFSPNGESLHMKFLVILVVIVVVVMVLVPMIRKRR